MSTPIATYPLDTWDQTQGFGDNPEFYASVGQKGHNGLDSKAAVGTPIFACASGVVDFAGWGGHDSRVGEIAGYTVIIRHTWGYSSYNHQSKVLVKAGDKVTAKTKIGLSGKSGWATGPHVHFDVWPLTPNWDNGYAGRVRPSSLVTLKKRSYLNPPKKGTLRKRIKTGGAVVHKSPDTKSPSLVKIPKGTLKTLKAWTPGSRHPGSLRKAWFKVTHNGITGWIHVSRIRNVTPATYKRVRRV